MFVQVVFQLRKHFFSKSENILSRMTKQYEVAITYRKLLKDPLIADLLSDCSAYHGVGLMKCKLLKADIRKP